MKALPAAGFGGGEGSTGEGAGVSFSDGFTGIGSEEPGNGTTTGSDGGVGAAAGVGAGGEGEAGAGVGADGDGGDSGALGVNGVIPESKRGGAAEEASFGVSAGFAGGRFDPSAGFGGVRDGGGIGPFVFASSGFSLFAFGSCMKGGKLGAEGAAPVGDLSGAGEGEAPLPEPAGMGVAAGGAAGVALGCVFCGVEGGSMPPMGRMVVGGRGLVALSSFAAPFVVLPLFTSGDKDDEEGASVPPFTGAGEVVFCLVPVDPAEDVSHSPAPITGGKVGFGCTGTGAVGLLGVIRFCSLSKDRLILDDTGVAPVEEADGLGARLLSRSDAPPIPELEATEAAFDFLAESVPELLPSVGEGGGGVLAGGGSDVVRTGFFGGVAC